MSQLPSPFSGHHLKATDGQTGTERFVRNGVASAINGLGNRLVQDASAPGRSGALDIAIPIYNNAPVVKDCLNSLLPTLSEGDQVWLMNDASDEVELKSVVEEFINQWPATRHIRNHANCGFVSTANLAFRITHRDLVLLNSDTRVRQGWLEHLQHTLKRNPRAGIICPVSDRASLLSVLPGDIESAMERSSVLSSGDPLLPTAVGFCMLISRQLINQAGVFDPAFAPGYGEENDFSMRALKLGFDIQVADRASVLHLGGGSFDVKDSRVLQLKHQKVLEQRWPEYGPLVQSWWRENPLREKTERLARPDDDRTAITHVLHRQYHIGGTERVTRELISTLRKDYWNTLVYPGTTTNPWCDFELRSTELCRELMLNNRWIAPSTRLAGHAADLLCSFSERALARVIRGSGSGIVHFHHLLHWDSLLLPALAHSLGARVVISVHDFYFNCPIHNQLEYSVGQPCGRRHAQADERCSACLNAYAAGGQMPGGVTAYAKGRHAVIQLILGLADAITVPSHFMRAKILEAFDLPDRDRLHVISHGTALPGLLQERPIGEDVVLGYFGGDQTLKGAGLVVQLARRLLEKRVQIRIYGRIKGFDPTQMPDNVTLCGFYNPGDVSRAMSSIDLCLVPSQYEESFSLIVSESWAHGVPVVTSNRGALRERVIDGVNGWLVSDLTVESWFKTIIRLLQDDSIEKVRKHLKGRHVLSTEDAGQAYTQLYRQILSAPNPRNGFVSEELMARPASTVTVFEKSLRSIRSRHICQDAPWFKPAHGPGRARPRQCLGIMRDQWGTAQYRVRFPLEGLAADNFSEQPIFHIVRDSGFSAVESARNTGARHVLVQPFLSEEGLAMMESLSRQTDLHVTLVVDDLWTALPEDNPVRSMMPVDVYDRLSYVASLCHHVVLTTIALERRLGLKHPGMQVIENALPLELWQSVSRKTAKASGNDSTGNDSSGNDSSGRPRIGWAGAPQHTADLEFLEQVIRGTKDEADWVFLGMCPERLRPHVKEVQPMRPFAEYPAALASAGLDLALAPLADNDFNRCKSHLKVLEYGVLGIPVIASDLEPYSHCPVELIAGTDAESWQAAIRKALGSPLERKRQGEVLRHWVLDHHMMHHRCVQWRQAMGLADAK